ncbi:MAG: DUF3298 domain-containing protein [Lachnospiraceae bacterium]|nr:DUF3298 domain-containing protein [Lachnospiraceae bacterium]
MKKSMLYFGALIVILLSGCGGKKDIGMVGEQQADTEWKMVETTELEDLEESTVQELMPVYYLTQDNHILRKSDDDVVMLKANYYTIKLNSRTKENYPELAKVIDDYNLHIAEEIESRADSMLRSVEDEYPLWEMAPFEIRRGFQETRSDSMAFSFVAMDYEFSGGIHGYVSWQSRNINPKTGEEIAFSDVVKNTEELPEIIIREIKLQHEDIMDYYTRMPDAEERVRQYIADYKLPDNAANFTWSIGDEGIWFYFEDYELGCYSAGAKRVEISYEDYPEIYTGVYSMVRDYKEDICTVVYEEGCAYLYNPLGERIAGPYLNITDDMRTERRVICRYTGMNGLIGYLDREGNEITPPIYIEASEMKDLRAIVSEKEGSIYYINEKGERVSDFYMNGYPYEHQGNYARFQNEDGWGLINEDGEIVFYGADMIQKLPEIDVLGTAVKDGHAILFSLGDEFEILKEYEKFIAISEAYFGTFAIVKNEDNLFGVINYQGDLVIEDKYLSIDYEVLDGGDTSWYGDCVRFDLKNVDGTFELVEVDF